MMLKALLPLHGKKEKPPFQVAWKRDPGATRTRDPQLRRLLLYPTELRDPESRRKDNKKKHLPQKAIIANGHLEKCYP